MAKRKAKKKRISEALAIAGLLLNILVIPGLGSLIAGRKKEGTWQLVLFLLGIPFALILIGIPMMIASWIWGLVTGIDLIKESQ